MRPLEESELPVGSDLVLGEAINEGSEGVKEGHSTEETSSDNLEL